jgi:hypothetical protein
MNNVPGKPGLVSFFLGYVLNIATLITQTNITFILGTVAMLFTILYYAIQIYKSLKK